MPARIPASVRRKISSATGRSEASANSRASRSSPRAPIQPDAIWARRSPIIFSLNLTFRRISAKRSSLAAPAR